MSHPDGCACRACVDAILAYSRTQRDECMADARQRLSEGRRDVAVLLVRLARFANRTVVGILKERRS